MDLFWAGRVWTFFNQVFHWKKKSISLEFTLWIVQNSNNKGFL